MDCFPFNTDDRDGLIADLTERLMRDWSRRLLAGDARSISDLHNVVLERLTEADAAAVFVQVVTDAAGAQAQLTALVSATMRAECENDALKQIEQAEHRRAQSAQDARIEQRVWNHFFSHGVAA